MVSAMERGATSTEIWGGQFQTEIEIADGLQRPVSEEGIRFRNRNLPD